MIVLEWERHKEIIVLGGLAHDQGPGPRTLNYSHSCGVLRKKLLTCSGQAETSGNTVCPPELPSQLRASVLCFRKKENFWKSFGRHFLFLGSLPIYSKCILRDVVKINNHSHKPVILKSWLLISVAKKALFEAIPTEIAAGLWNWA